MTRPSRSDPALREIAVGKLAEECAQWAGDKASDWLDHLRRVNLHGNGYEIARDLERYAYVSPDEELVEILSSASSYLWDAHTAAVKDWVARNDIKATLPRGARIRCRHGEGIINDIREDEGIYLLLTDEDANDDRFKNGGGIHVPYEDAEPVAEAA